MLTSGKHVLAQIKKEALYFTIAFDNLSAVGKALGFNWKKIPATGHFGISGVTLRPITILCKDALTSDLAFQGDAVYNPLGTAYPFKVSTIKSFVTSNEVKFHKKVSLGSFMQACEHFKLLVKKPHELKSSKVFG